MSVEAFSGPSTTRSSPVVPSTARKLQIKRRVVNLVNPADPLDFSDPNSPPSSSFANSLQYNDDFSSAPPLIPRIVNAIIPLEINENGVKGILRPSGTPGSGNGVRFFPKNRFRVITPNQSLLTPQPPSPSSNSFLSQLLATVPSISPRKAPVTLEKPDESWEVPGQEGEVSLVESSAGSLLDEPQDEQDAEREEEAWSGTPEKHSSPLALTATADLSASQEFELPSADWQVPEDVSNLLSQRFEPQADVESFTIPELHSQAPRDGQIPAQAEDPSVVDESMRSTRSTKGLNDSNPTIRRRLYPVRPDQLEVDPETPTPALRPFASIFEDMSAEQADLSWPLARPVAGEETIFHSADLGDLDLISEAHHMVTTTPKTGDITQFYDCTATSPFPPAPSLSASSASLISQAPPTPMDLKQPIKALFNAHSAHTSALASELSLYRALAEKLHAEVAERDGVLAELNVKALEGEVWKVKVDELEEKLKSAKSVTSRVTESSPLPVSLAQNRSNSVVGLGDQTTVVRAETRDLEIRLAKALADQEILSKELLEERAETARRSDMLEKVRTSLRLSEERARDCQVRDEGFKAQLNAAVEIRGELENAQRLELELRVQLDEAARRTTRLENQVDEFRAVKLADEEEMAQLAADREKLKEGRKREEEWRSRVSELERNVEAERIRRLEAERRTAEEKQARNQLESYDRELMKSLQSTRADLATATSSHSRETGSEIQRLRSESASKDLEILNLLRRKAELKEDREMLNIALDSKQQELELVKRRFAVRGVAGSTPLAESSKTNFNGEIGTPAPNKVLDGGDRRRSSMTFVTPVERGRMLKGGHGLALSRSTAKTGRVMRRVEEENRPLAGAIPRERMLV